MEKPNIKILQENSKISDFSEFQNTKKDIYHYTDLKSLLGILESNKLRLTNSFFLNDSSEYIYGTKIVKYVITRFINKKSFPHLKSHLLRLSEKISNSDYIRELFFTASFCSNSDLLSQWRGYSGKTGVNIKFEMSLLATYLDLKILPVIYDIKVQQGIIELLLGKYLPMIPNDYEYELSKFDDPINSIIVHLCNFLPFFKNPKFSEEKEFRILKVIDKKTESDYIKYIESNNRIKSFIELPFEEKKWKNEIPFITLGPGNNLPNLKNDIRILLKNLDLNVTKIRISKIPYIN